MSVILFFNRFILYLRSLKNIKNLFKNVLTKKSKLKTQYK